MTNEPEIVFTPTRRVSCDGASGIRPGPGYKPSALGHPRVWLEIDGSGFVDCGYCDRRYVLESDPHARGDKEVFPGDLPSPGDASVS